MLEIMEENIWFQFAPSEPAEGRGLTRPPRIIVHRVVESRRGLHQSYAPTQTVGFRLSCVEEPSHLYPHDHVVVRRSYIGLDTQGAGCLLIQLHISLQRTRYSAYSCELCISIAVRALGALRMRAIDCLIISVAMKKELFLEVLRGILSYFPPCSADHRPDRQPASFYRRARSVVIVVYR